MKNTIIILIGIVLLNSSCSSLSEEDRKKIEEETFEKYSQYGDAYNRAYAYVNNVTSNKIDPLDLCNALNDTLIDSINLNVLYIEELKKFTATNNEEFIKYQDEWMDSDWKWMSTARYSLDDNLHSWPTDFSYKDLKRTIFWFNKEATGSILTSSEFAVIVPVSPEKNHMPELIDDESFLSGNFVGWVIIFSNYTFEMICAREFEVANNELLEFKEYGGRRGNLINTLSGNEPEKVIKKDFKKRFKLTLDLVFENYETDYGGF